jgi:very-short-patch-repair endonuclease
MTDAEIRLWYLLRDRRLSPHKFKRQVPIGPWIADFVCPARHLVVEVDGGQHSGNTHDVDRERDLRSRGYRVVRYWNDEVLNNTEGVLTHLLDALDGKTPI